MADENESRLARIERKIDDLTTEVFKQSNADTRQEMRIEQLEIKVEGLNQTLKNHFERLAALESKPAKAALMVWAKTGNIALSVIVTAIVTFILVYVGVKK